MNLTRRQLLHHAGACGAAMLFANRFAPAAVAAKADGPLPALIDSLLNEFVIETLPDGRGVDRGRSRWQARGRGSAAGSAMFAGSIDPRYFRFEIESLYRCAAAFPGADGPRWRQTADSLVAYMAKEIKPAHASWATGNALECFGLSRQYKGALKDPAAACKPLIDAARARSLEITTSDGVKFRHFPCGYGVLDSKDAGWTNDLSMFGSGLVHAFELTRDESILADAVSFAEYFVQPWKPDSLGKDGYWHCGTFHQKIGSWVIGPSHYSGFESTDVFGDEASWVFSTVTCTDFLTRLHRHHPDPRYLDRCVKAAQWTFKSCQFDDGAVGMCGRDDKWLGFTADAVSQVAMLKPLLPANHEAMPELLRGAKRASDYIDAQLSVANTEEHGVRWVHKKSSTDPLCNVAMLWASLLLGWLNARELLR
jgi:hypothetical protein